MKILAAEGLVKAYRGKRVVDSVDFDVKAGQIVGLLGPNGAGKTTSFYMIVGLTKPDEGKISLGGQDLTRLPMYARSRLGLSYLPQEASIFRKMTVEENILAILETLPLSKSAREERLDVLLKELNISHLAHRLAYSLSGGERRRVEITRALVTSPSFILLDEPFAGIDPIAVLDIQKIVGRLKEMEIGVLITDHNVQETLEITDHAYIINNGKIIESGTPEEIANSEQAREIYLGEKFKLSDSVGGSG